MPNVVMPAQGARASAEMVSGKLYPNIPQTIVTS